MKFSVRIFFGLLLITASVVDAIAAHVPANWDKFSPGYFICLSFIEAIVGSALLATRPAPDKSGEK